MFCDLVGSRASPRELDAEDWRNLVNAYLDEASAAVTGLGGHVLKKLGDGLMALFGYPQAQENDAERAVRAALAIQRALSDLNARNAGKGAPELRANRPRSGQVVVEATGEVFGDAPNVAARVQAAAEPGSVLVTMNVQRQVAGLFVAEDKAPRTQGRPSRSSSSASFARAAAVEAARARRRFVGREEELGLLARRWERARAGEGQLVLIVGEPGLGKSRLIEEFHAKPDETPHTWVEWSASQLLQNTPLHPVAEWGRQRFDADLPAQQRLADLENTLGLVDLDPTEYAPLLAPLVGVPLPAARAPTAGAGRDAPAAVGGDHRPSTGGGARATDRARLRGSAMGRPDVDRRFAGLERARRTGPALHRRDGAAGVSHSVGHALASQPRSIAARSRA